MKPSLGKTLAAATLALIITVMFSACSSKQTAQAPKKLIEKYIAMHETMVDTHLADLYVEEEQQVVTGLVTKTISAKKTAGNLDELLAASFDLSGLSIQVLGQKEEYVNDEPKDFLKIGVTGKYSMKMGDIARQLEANTQLILEKEGKNWKVTEKINPWG